MTTNVESLRRGSISHVALSAGIAFSCTSVSDEAAAQQSGTVLEPITVSRPTQPRAARPAPAPQPAETTEAQPIQGGPDQPAGVPEGVWAVPTVESPRFTAPILDTPQTITVIPQQIIREQGARNLTEVLRNTPGITFDAGENGFSTSTNNFKLRGFDGSGNIFIDNSRDSGSYTRDIFNTERVEVFKGAAADNGRGGPGGYINMVTKTPRLQNFFSGDVSYGWDNYRSNPQRRATVDANYVIAPNTALRINGLLESSGVAGRDIAEMQPSGFAPSLAFGLGTNARAIFAYEHLRRKDLPDWGVPGATIPGLASYFQSNGIAAGAPRDAFYGLRTDYDKTTADSFLARFEYDFTKDATFSNQSRWSRVDRTARYTVPTGFTAATMMVPTQTQFYDRVNTTFTNITNVSAKFWTGPVRHSIATGFEYTREDSNANRYNTLNRTPTGLFDPNPDRDGAIAPDPTQMNGIAIDTIAAYFYDTIELNRFWEITGGLRAERYNVNIESRNLLTGAGLAPLDGYEDQQKTLGGKIGVVFKPVEEGSIYAAYSVTHQPPGSYLSNPDISRTGENAFPGFVMDVKPIKATNYEVGIKWDFLNKRLSTALAVFRTVKENVPITGLTAAEAALPPAVRPAAYFWGYGEQAVEGVEMSVAGDLTEDWKVFGGMLFLRSERTLSPELDAARRNANPADYVGWDGTRYCCANGDDLSFTPKFSGNLWTTYRVPNTKLTIGGGVQHTSWSWVGRPDDALRIIPNNVFGTLPGYTVFNAMASYELWKDVHLRFNVDNITDEKFPVAVNWNTSRATLGAPRTFRVSTSFKF